MDNTVGIVDVEKVVLDICHRIDVATDREPWERLSRSERIDHLPPLVTALVDGLVTEGPPASEALLENAYIHGAHRAAQGFDEELILEEYYILREQVYRALRCDRELNETVALTYRMDPAITEATIESLLGYHGATPRLRP